MSNHISCKQILINEVETFMYIEHYQFQLKLTET